MENCCWLNFGFVISLCGSRFGWVDQWATISDLLPSVSCSQTHDHLGSAPLLGRPFSSSDGSEKSHEARLRTKSFHCIALGDPLKPASEKLAALFDEGSSSLVSFKSSHKPPTQQTVANELAAFLCDCI